MTKLVRVVELRYKRCDLRFGISPCPAVGDVKCFNTYATCQAKLSYNPGGGLSWYFHKQGDPVPPTAALPAENFPYPPSIPILRSIRAEATRINLGAVRENESPFGLRGEVTVELSDFEFRNQFGDFYADEREVRGSLGKLLLAWLGEAVPQVELYVYTGTDADAALTDMTVKRYDVTNISPPSGGTWSITGIDPLARAERKKAQFPPATDLRIQSDIDATTTEISVSGLESDVSKAMGNDGFFYGRLGSEIIRYTGYTGADGVWALTGVTRAALNTQASNHSVDDGMQRCGHYENILYWEMVYDLLTNHTTIPSELIPLEDWQAEGRSWLSTLKGTGTVTQPRPVAEICAEAMRDGMFSIWWDERAQNIPMLALRQPVKPPVTLTERNAIVSSAIKRSPDERRTRVTIYYQRRDPTESLEEGRNYRQQRIRIDPEAEGPNFADGTVRNLIWYSPFLRTDLNAILVQASFLLRYRDTPEYLELALAYKDSNLRVGDVIFVESFDTLDTLGNPLKKPWQIIEWEETEPGFAYRILCQSFILFERPAFIMANNAPTFAAATDEEKENACFLAGADDLMPDGSVAYVIQ